MSSTPSYYFIFWGGDVCRRSVYSVWVWRPEVSLRCYSSDAVHIVVIIIISSISSSISILSLNDFLIDLDLLTWPTLAGQ